MMSPSPASTKPAREVTADDAEERLAMRGIVKTFPGVRALDGVDFGVRRGEIMGLVGENGAGKSTLMKVLSGAYEQDAGTIHLNGQQIEVRRPAAFIGMNRLRDTIQFG